MNTSNWEQGIENNMALYDIRVNVSHDETLGRSDLRICRDVNVIEFDCVDTADGFSLDEIRQIHSRHGNEPSDEYLFVAHRAGGNIRNPNQQTGVNLPTPAMAAFTDAHTDDAFLVTDPDVKRSPYSTAIALVVSKTVLHELGHSFRIGSADDVPIPERPSYVGEVYSGEDGVDHTTEVIRGLDGRTIMRKGWSNRMLVAPMGGRYFAFSIEESTTVEEP